MCNIWLINLSFQYFGNSIWTQKISHQLNYICLLKLVFYLAELLQSTTAPMLTTSLSCSHFLCLHTTSKTPNIRKFKLFSKIDLIKLLHNIIAISFKNHCNIFVLQLFRLPNSLHEVGSMVLEDGPRGERSATSC